jgi:hypothetical protein
MITLRLVCEVPHCRRRIFAERFGDDVVPICGVRTPTLQLPRLSERRPIGSLLKSPSP